VLDVFASEFDGLYRRGAIFVSVHHPMVAGRPSRLAMLERLIRHMRRPARVWWATTDEIARHCETVAPSLETVTAEIPPARWLRPS
jgi:peptidoglycan-N-acetylglucosamine deacetylase